MLARFADWLASGDLIDPEAGAVVPADSGSTGPLAPASLKSSLHLPSLPGVAMYEIRRFAPSYFEYFSVF